MTPALLVRTNPSGNFPEPWIAPEAVVMDGQVELVPNGDVTAENPVVILLLSPEDYPVTITAVEPVYAA